MRTAFAALVVALLSGASALAADCSGESDDDARLTCYDDLAACGRLADKKARLACYDRGRASKEDLAALDDRSTSVAVSAPSNMEEGITATILAVETNPRNIDYLSLDDGSVWRETEDSRVRFSEGQKVRLERGIFGSTNLTIEGMTRRVKVKRVRQ